MSLIAKIKHSVIFALCLAACLFISSPAFALTADPMDLSVGARAMGMGNAYVGVAENSETVFSNPAGLGTISSLKLGSMYTSLMDDVNYTVISGAYPMDNNSGTLGAGLIRQAVTGIPLYNDYGTPEGSGTYGSDVLFISHGFDMSKKYFPNTSNLYGGYTLKYYMKSATGYETSDMAGSGYSADLGLLYKPKGAMSYGLTLQNILSGKMSYANGEEDAIGSAMKVGTKISLMGDTLNGASVYQSESKVDVALDYNMGISGAIPGTLHAGVEYKPLVGVNYIDKILTLRAGVNQVPTPAGNISNITMGVGILYQGIEFNFASVSMYGEVPETATNYFSISYVGIPAPVKPIEEMKPLISQIMPSDKVITRDPAILIQGRVSSPAKIAKVEINNAGVNVNEAGAFEMNVPLSTVGKHLVTVRATDLTGKSEEKQVKVIRLVKFADVPENHWVVNPIEQLATAGLVEGYPNGTFQPERALSRAELATLLAKSKEIALPDVTRRVFKDMPPSHWAARYVKGAYDIGLVKGYPDGTFKPNVKITRTEGVVVLTRFGELPRQNALATNPYPDMSARNWASPFVAAARTAGLLDYIGDNYFEPKREFTRAEAVEILAKTSYGRAKVDNLLDWTVGFEPAVARPSVATAYPYPGQIGRQSQQEQPVSSANPYPGQISRQASYQPEQANVVGKPTPKGGSFVQQAPSQQLKEFSDVSEDNFASNSIKYLATAGVMDGYPSGMFKPNRVVTRAELASILVKARNIDVSTNRLPKYSDVSRSNWAAPYIKASVDYGYMTGKSGNKFEPNKGATRAEAVAAIVKFDSMALPSNLRAGPFPDMSAKDWSSTYVSAAKESGMLDYLQGQNFEGKKSITRAELAELLSKTTFGMAKIEQIRSASTY